MESHFLKGQESPLEVTEPKVEDEKEKTSSDNQAMSQTGGPDVPTAEVNKSKMQLFNGKYAADLHIRSKPSLMVSTNNTKI